MWEREICRKREEGGRESQGRLCLDPKTVYEPKPAHLLKWRYRIRPAHLLGVYGLRPAHFLGGYEQRPAHVFGGGGVMN